MNLSLVIPSRNNEKYAKFAYNSIRKYLGKEVEIILMNDASTDDTLEWMLAVKLSDNNVQLYSNQTSERVGHTVLYDIGADMAKNEVFGIFHADMVATPNYVKNMMKHVQPKRVVSGTRIEPPLHPPGPEKEVMDFGMEPEVFQEESFLKWVNTLEGNNKDKITHGVFAPWVMYVKDFKAIGGHDKRVFAPMELEDSDIFNRMLLAGYNFVQSRDAYVYHMTCRGSRFKDGVKIVQEIPVGGGHVWKRAQDSEEYIKLRQNKFREWWRKWHMDVLHDDHMRPIVWPRYNTGYVVTNCSLELIPFIEPWCDNLYIENKAYVDMYVEDQQPATKFNMSKRVKAFGDLQNNDIYVRFDGSKFTQESFNILKQLPIMVQDSGEVGVMEYDIFTLDIRVIKPLEKELVHADNPWYVNQLL